jgi:hypothetical protein
MAQVSMNDNRLGNGSGRKLPISTKTHSKILPSLRKLLRTLLS